MAPTRKTSDDYCLFLSASNLRPPSSPSCSAGIRQAEGDFNAPALLLDAQRINASRLACCAKHFNPAEATAEQLLEWVYGIDHLIDVNGTDKIYAAIDLTANKAECEDGQGPAHRSMWSELGVEQFFVIHVDGDPADLTKAGAIALIDKLWVEMNLLLTASAVFTSFA